MWRWLLVAVLPLGACKSSLPTLRAETVTHPELLRPGTAGTLSILLDGVAGCQWLRSEPGEPALEVHQFGVRCPGAELFWSDTGERALLEFDGHSAASTAWEVDLARGDLWEISPPPGERGPGGYVSPDGEITLKTSLVYDQGFARRVKGAIGLNGCDGEFRGYRSVHRGTWHHVADRGFSCDGQSLKPWDRDLGEDFTWSRPGVVSTLSAGTAMHSRGDYQIHQRQRRGPDGSEPPITAGHLEYWPAPVQPEGSIPVPDTEP